MFRICSFVLLVSSLFAEQADWIWSARYVITEDAQHRVIENGAVAIRADRIVGVGARAEIDARDYCHACLPELHTLSNPVPSVRAAAAAIAAASSPATL